MDQQRADDVLLLRLGLEARREFDLGELRERRRFALPVLAGIGGMAVRGRDLPRLQRGPFVGARLGRGDVDRHRVRARPARARRAALPRPVAGLHAHGRRRRRHPRAGRHRDRVHRGGRACRRCWSPRRCSALVLVVQGARRARRSRLRRCSERRSGWRCSSREWSPIVVGLAMGLLAYAYPAARAELERATERFREFREQPTPELARSAGVGLRAAISPNERLQLLYHPWTSYVIVPLFALANAGIAIDGAFLERAFTSPITLGILFGYVVGQADRDRRRLVAADAADPRAVAPARRLGGAGRRRHDRRDRLHRRAAGRDDRVHRRGARGGQARHPERRARRVAPHLADLPGHGAASAAASGSARCSAPPSRSSISTSTSTPSATTSAGRSTRRSPSSSTATSSARTAARRSPSSASFSRDFGDVRYVWRHLPLSDVHPQAQLAAEAAEAAADQGAFWEMHDLLLAHQDALGRQDLVALRRAARARRRALHRRSAQARGAGAGGRGRRQRRPQRRLRHSDLLHQRPAPLRRLRHRHPLGGRPRRRGACDLDDPEQRLTGRT